jgi:hypothetical protein
MYYSTNTNSFRCFQNNVWVSCVGGLLYANTSIPTGACNTTNTVANTASECNFGTNYTLPANYCVPGRVIRVIGQGIFSSTGSPTLTFKIKFGTTAIGTSPATSATSSGSTAFRVEFQIICDTTGASGTVEGQGIVFVFNNASSSTDSQIATAGTTTVDTTASQTAQMSVTWSAANAANTITLRQFIVEGLGP